jgi:hypothetical protein
MARIQLKKLNPVVKATGKPTFIPLSYFPCVFVAISSYPSFLGKHALVYLLQLCCSHHHFIEMEFYQQKNK